MNGNSPGFCVLVSERELFTVIDVVFVLFRLLFELPEPFEEVMGLNAEKFGTCVLVSERELFTVIDVVFVLFRLLFELPEPFEEVMGLNAEKFGTCVLVSGCEIFAADLSTIRAAAVKFFGPCILLSD